MDYFSALTVFHAVAETGGFSAAAKRLHLAVSSVTRQIDNLEQTLGTVLFSRSTRQISLTNAGIHYLERTRNLLDELESANQSLKNELTRPQGKLRITFANGYGDIVLAPLLAEFALRYPQIQLEVYSADEYVDLLGERFDLGIRLGKADDPNLVAKRIRGLKRLLCAAPGYLDRCGTPSEPNELSGHNCLLYSYRGYPQRWYFSRNGQRVQAVNVKGNLTGNNVYLLCRYARAGIGIAHLPDWIAQPHLDSGELVSLLPDWQVKPSDTDEEDAVFLVYPPNSRQMMKISLLAEFLTERLGE